MPSGLRPLRIESARAAALRLAARLAAQRLAARQWSALRTAAIVLAAGLLPVATAAWAQPSSPGVREAARAELPAVPSPARATPGAIDDSPLRSDPRTVVTAVEQATRLAREGKPDAALSSLEASLKIHPRDPQLRFLYGVVMAEQKRTDDAIAVFEQLTQDFPELPEPHNNLAVVLAGRGDLDRARHALENAVRALPGYALAQENLGDVYLRMAARAYERAGQLDPRNADSRNKLALSRELLAKVAPRAPGEPAPAAPK